MNRIKMVHVSYFFFILDTRFYSPKVTFIREDGSERDFAPVRGKALERVHRAIRGKGSITVHDDGWTWRTGNEL